MVRGKERDRKSYYTKVTCPTLQSLEILDAEFYANYEVGKLQDCLMERCNRKAELRKLMLFNRINLCEEDVNRLRGIVVDVDQDK